MPKVSVIIPIFGVEKYIERCARSLFEQTLDDIEFIFVDDCTTDNSIAILKNIIEEYPSRKDQTKILHHEHNKGLSFTRETGVNAATGEYIAHCDSDDWIEENAYEEMYVFATSHHYDFVKCKHYTSNDQDKTIENVYGNSESVSKEEAISYLLDCKGWNSIWDTLVNRQLYTNISYTQDMMLEDFFVVTQLLIKSNNIGILNKPYYYYFKNTDSICGLSSETSIINKVQQARRNIQWILNFIHSNTTKNFEKEECVLKYVPRRLIIPIMSRYQNYTIWNNLFPGNSFNFIFKSDQSIVLKLQYLLVLLRIYPIYYKLIKK